MYIKSVVIQGFKTYKNITTIADLSPQFNVVIGGNGSGKSNFFAAVRFVLSDDYSNLKREERQGLIHQGTGSIMSAYVEIVFHDPNGQMMMTSGIPTTDENLVRVRRTIGLKKDEYSVNGKTCHKSDITRMFESVGFSSANPYNIVPQGRIVAVTNAKDKERLALLEEVVGAKSFETRLKESIKKMEVTNRDRAKIDSELQELKTRLEELDEERHELEKYQELERDKRIFQFVLYDRELNEVTSQIENLEDEYNQVLQSSEDFVQELSKRETLISDVSKNMASVETELKVKESTDLQQEKSRLSEVSKRKADLEVRLEEIKRQSETRRGQTATDQHNLKIIEEEIITNKSQLNRLLPRFEELRSEAKQYENQLSDLNRKQREMTLKRGIYARFEDQEERNEWIREELKSLELQHGVLDMQLSTMLRDKEEIASEIGKLQEEITELNDSVRGPGVSAELEDLQAQISGLKRHYFHKIDERKELWRSEQRLQTISEALLDSVKRSERNLSETIDRGLANGLKAVREIADRLKLPSGSVRGTLGELIKVSEKYKTCAEAVGGNSLLHVVVDTDETASILMQELYNAKAGRVTFVPLNRLNTNSVISYPDSSQADFTPLLWKIKYDKSLEAAVRHVFGRTIVVRDLGTSSKLARAHNLDAVTLDGDRADKKGLITGGFHDYHKKSRLDALKDISTSKSQLSDASNSLEAMKEQIAAVDVEIDRANSGLKSLSIRKEAILTNNEVLRVKLNKRSTELSFKKDLLDGLESKIEKAETSARMNKEKTQRYEVDLTQPFEKSLTLQEEDELKSLAGEMRRLSDPLSTTTEALDKLTVKIDLLKTELDAKLYPQKKEIEGRLSQASGYSHALNDEEVRELTEDLHGLASREKDLKTSVSTITEAIDALNEEKATNQRLMDKANSQQRLLLKKLDNFQKNAEKSVVKKTALISRRDEVQQKISEIGLLSEDSLERHQNLNSEQILRQLNNVNDKISKMSNINRRAIENYKKFNEKREEMEKRAEELVYSKDSIEKLIDSLKKQKVEAVEATFSKVAQNFSTIFEKLVPAGSGKLIIHRRPQGVERNFRAVREDSIPSSNDIDGVGTIYQGVSISVSFNSKKNEQLYVEQLSGGQKTVCAIALILAIQMVEPAPFYLFDEIDAALDKQYRTSVASVIKELSVHAQFICTTFRTDMIQVADSFYRVKFDNKISEVQEVSQQDAIKFIKRRNKIGLL
ncbi:LANO_0F05930g1_1 [Lachancea nothofagi CBS 11611]|uniref:Structural maintenance of chromosomes protein n=1 Tax=Lachancea nothofagi CBS 11611 TaxID=1266666 RepID=A0A1G4K8E0_9SACH|nr:LANO_0F05930g1_1 [Lachancea nothofagi CBS 11611]